MRNTRILMPGLLALAALLAGCCQPDAPTGAITDAIGALEPGNPDHWTKAGKLRVKALEERLDHDISAADRDLAWRMSH